MAMEEVAGGVVMPWGHPGSKVVEWVLFVSEGGFGCKKRWLQVSCGLGREGGELGCVRSKEGLWGSKPIVWGAEGMESPAAPKEMEENTVLLRWRRIGCLWC